MSQQNLQKNDADMAAGLTATRTCVTNFEKVDRDVTDLMAKLGPGWQGAAGSAFSSSLADWHGKFKTILRSLNEISHSLEAADKKMNANEDQNLTYAKAAFNSGEHSSRVFNGIVA